VRLERALLFTFATHGLGMLSMALWLLPGMPGGGAATDAARIHYIATHAWWWRLGWFPWQLSALSDLLLAAALLRTPWVPRLPALLTALATVAAVIPDQLGQACWITRGIALAQSASAEAYLAYERRIFQWTAAWGATLYCVAALGWTWAFAGARVWSRGLGVLSGVLWPLFFAVSLGPFLGVDGRLVAAGNGLAFLLMQLWLAMVAEAVLRRARPDAACGRLEPWRHPRWRLLDVIANSRFLRAWGELVPIVAFRSDVRDVVYVNYLVERERLEPLVPPGLELQRLGPEGRLALFTFLTYRHGNLGPRFLGPLRRLLPSPIQSNWRIYVRHPRSGRDGIFFVTSALSSAPHALAARLLAESMPMHVPRHAELDARGDGIRLSIDPGRGSAPDATALLRPAPPPADGPWRACFPSWRDFLAYAVPQDRAMSAQGWADRVTSQEISLGIPLEACAPMAGEVRSRRAQQLVGAAVPICFHVARVKFSFVGEERLPL
jgi:hypothetical protein